MIIDWTREIETRGAVDRRIRRLYTYQRVNDWLIAHTPELIVAVLVVLVLV